MKKAGSAIVIILSLVAITVIVVSVLNVRAPASVDPTPTAVPSATVPVFLTTTLSSTPDPCAPENIEATIVEFDKLSREFSDTFILAQNTPAVQLSPVISKLQQLRRSAEDFKVPGCLSTLKEHQLGFMNTAIATSLLLYSSFAGEATQTMTKDQMSKIVLQVNQYMRQASDYGNKYTIEMARLLGITLTPSYTPEPTSLSTPSVTAAVH